MNEFKGDHDFKFCMKCIVTLGVFACLTHINLTINTNDNQGPYLIMIMDSIFYGAGTIVCCVMWRSK